MLNTHRLNRHAALCNSRGGFTLVELLVVIGIIAILAGVALGPITNGIKKAQQSAGLQSAHAIGLAMYAFANDNQQLYPDTGNPGVPSGNSAAGALAAAQPLMAGGYVTDPTIFGLSGDASSTYVKVSSATNTALTLTVAQISWDFLGNGGAGVNSTSYPFLPLIWSTCNAAAGGTTAGSEPTTFNVAAGLPITAVPGTNNPFGTSGVAVFYINNASAFVTTSIQTGVLKASLVSAANNLGGAPSTYVVLGGT